MEFKDPSSVKKALEIMNKTDFKGRKLVVKEVRVAVIVLFLFFVFCLSLVLLTLA